MPKYILFLKKKGDMYGENGKMHRNVTKTKR